MEDFEEKEEEERLFSIIIIIIMRAYFYGTMRPEPRITSLQVKRRNTQHDKADLKTPTHQGKGTRAPPMQRPLYLRGEGAPGAQTVPPHAQVPAPDTCHRSDSVHPATTEESDPLLRAGACDPLAAFSEGARRSPAARPSRGTAPPGSPAEGWGRGRGERRDARRHPPMRTSRGAGRAARP
ncbi:uncharacterized protein RBU33_027002 isoform 1-T1 [Hipposideros larvatus]